MRCGGRCVLRCFHARSVIHTSMGSARLHYGSFSFRCYLPPWQLIHTLFGPCKHTHIWSRRLCVSALKRPPITVEQTRNAGRGVFATRDINPGEFIYSADPVVAHPKLDSISKVCYSCLKLINHQLSPLTVTSSQELQSSRTRLDKVPGTESHSLSPRREVSNFGEAVLFCSAACAAKKFYMIERKVDWSELHHYCRVNGVRFPLVARRLVCMIAAGVASPDALDILAFRPLYDGTPLAWEDERVLIVKLLKGAKLQGGVLDFLSKEWYAGVMARLYLNAFAVEMIDSSGHVDLLDAAASSIMGEASVGTAVYTLPSMFNHDCDPNVNVSWPGTATLQLEARRMIGAGEELRITYLDASLAYDARQEILRDYYGFLCECPRCMVWD